jgi:hypothetical protein
MVVTLTAGAGLTMLVRRNPQRNELETPIPLEA